MDSGRVVRQGSGANRLLGYRVGRGLPDPALAHLLVFYWKIILIGHFKKKTFQ